MGFFEAYKMALKSILSNKGRSFLTMLGVIIGVGAVISAVAFAEGSTKNITDTIKGMGTNLITINITGRNSNRRVSYEDIMEFARENSSDIEMVAPLISTNATVKAGVNTGDTTILGTSPEYEAINNINVQSGRFLIFFDTEYMQRVAVIGAAVAEDIFEGGNPIGQDIKIQGQVFEVVGVLEEKYGGQFQSGDDQVIIPITVAQRLLGNTTIRNFSVQAVSPEAVDRAMDKLNIFLTDIFKDESAYRVMNQAQILETLGDITGIMMVVLGGIAAISLIVGGIGIMNIMLVSVTERTREIGIRKAIGAKKKNILVQFLIEALMVTGIGGILGILLGLSVIRFIIGGINIIPVVYSIPWCLISFGVSLGVGVIFGMFPAYKAANLNPIEALRYE